MIFGRQNLWVKNCGCHEQLFFIVGRPLVIIKVQAAQTHHEKKTKQNKTIFKEEKNLSYLFLLKKLCIKWELEKKIRAPDGIGTHDPPWSSRML